MKNHAMPSDETRARSIVIGPTPMRPIRLRIANRWHTVHLKLESFNPAGSSKDRTAASLLSGLEAGGQLGRGSTVVESSSGNLGVSLAFLCRERGIRFLAVVDPKTTEENLARMRQFGAEFELVSVPDELGGYLFSRLRRVQELCARHRHFVWTNQYDNPDNPNAHYRSTGPEILKQMSGALDAVFVAVSTGGTLAGISRFLREASPRTRVIGVDALGSVVFGGPPHARRLIGIGSARRSSFLDPSLFDGHLLVSDRDAFATCRQLDRSLGLRLGGSSGAVVFACARYLADHPGTRRIVCLCADSGANYGSTIYSDTWLQEAGLDPIENGIAEISQVDTAVEPAESEIQA